MIKEFKKINELELSIFNEPLSFIFSNILYKLVELDLVKKCYEPSLSSKYEA